MSYSYDRRMAAEKTWYDMVDEASSKFMKGVVDKLAKDLKGSGKTGAFGSGSVTYDKGIVRFGFKGGDNGMVYVIDPSEKRTEHSVVNHTPSSFANILLKREVIPAAS